MLDALAAVGAPALDTGADAALAIGLLAGLAAAAAGLADWSDTTDDPRSLGAAHGLLNGAALLAYAGALWLARGEARRTRRALAFVGYGIAGLAAFLGGELAFGMQLGAKHTAEPVGAPEEFIPTVSRDSPAELVPARVEVNGIPMLLSRRGDEVFAVSAVCTHRGGPLGPQAGADACVDCPWHGSRFSLLDGSVLAGPATFPLPRFETRVRAGMVEVRRFSVSSSQDEESQRAQPTVRKFAGALAKSAAPGSLRRARGALTQEGPATGSGSIGGRRTARYAGS